MMESNLKTKVARFVVSHSKLWRRLCPHARGRGNSVRPWSLSVIGPLCLCVLQPRGQAGRQAERPKLTLRNSATLTHRKAEFTPACILHVYYYNIPITNMNDGCGEAGCRVGKGQGKGHELDRGSAMCHFAMSYFSLRRAGRYVKDARMWCVVAPRGAVAVVIVGHDVSWW